MGQHHLEDFAMSSITLRFLAHQPDSLSGDKIRGGTLLHWMDEAGFACSCAWARGRCVTAFISSATFAHAVRAGWRPNGPIVVNSSRAILYASNGADFAAAARREAIKTRDMLQAARPL